MKQVSADIPLYLWESFIAVIEEKTLQKAADKLRTTQPTITRHLHQLEEALPLNLFELRGRTKVPTPFALQLHQKIRMRLQFLPEDIHQSLQQFAKSENVSLTIAGDLEVLKRFFCTVNFSGKLTLRESHTDDLKKELKDGRYDVIVNRGLVDTSLYICKKLFQEEFTLVVPKKFAKNKDLSDWKDRRSQFPMSLYSEDLVLSQELRGKMSVNFEVNDWTAIEAHVQKGLSWSIIPSSYVKKNSNYYSSPYSIRGAKMLTDFYIYYRRDLSRQIWFKDFLENIVEKSKSR
ncbi:LysR family transcriptional regulator [Bdellovibrio sp. HCB-110]|uniref:LysR family transcriptional regulator n=1 Tax=Bdellovibrio sp. HCB-110 TaxID=3391182 RepID=UPI0039B668BF